MDTRERIVSSALNLVQTRGFNAFSFRDIADEIGIRSASIHHYFPTKEDLGRELITSYREKFHTALMNISSSTPDALKQLDAFVSLLARSVEDGEKVCLCGVLMSDCETLEEPMRQELTKMTGEVENWAATVLKRGKDQGVLKFSEQPAVLARTLFASFQGIMLCARAHKEPARFARAARSLITLLKG
jgi:TetR/AcrR family transcriptional repressor of nem operon